MSWVGTRGGIVFIEQEYCILVKSKGSVVIGFVGICGRLERLCLCRDVVPYEVSHLPLICVQPKEGIAWGVVF